MESNCNGGRKGHWLANCARQFYQWNWRPHLEFFFNHQVTTPLFIFKKMGPEFLADEFIILDDN